jgi:hypothetical protein
MVVSQFEFQQWVLPESYRFVLPSFVFTVLSSPLSGLGRVRQSGKLIEEINTAIGREAFAEAQTDELVFQHGTNQ